MNERTLNVIENKLGNAKERISFLIFAFDRRTEEHFSFSHFEAQGVKSVLATVCHELSEISQLLEAGKGCSITAPRT